MVLSQSWVLVSSPSVCCFHLRCDAGGHFYCISLVHLINTANLRTYKGSSTAFCFLWPWLCRLSNEPAEVILPIWTDWEWYANALWISLPWMTHSHIVPEPACQHGWSAGWLALLSMAETASLSRGLRGGKETCPEFAICSGTSFNSVTINAALADSIHQLCYTLC